VRRATEQELAQAGMAVAFHDDEIHTSVRGVREQRVGNNLHIEVVTGEVLAHVGPSPPAGCRPSTP
jgi:hypothetical protein